MAPSWVLLRARSQRSLPTSAWNIDTIACLARNDQQVGKNPFSTCSTYYLNHEAVTACQAVGLYILIGIVMIKASVWSSVYSGTVNAQGSKSPSVAG